MVDTEQTTFSTARTEVRFFLGMCSMYGRFIPRLAETAILLHNETSKDEPSQSELLSGKESKTSRELKKCFCHHQCWHSPVIFIVKF